MASARAWIFLCNDATEREYLQRNVVATKENYLPRFEALEPGDPVLLYNFESGALVAFFTATGKAALDLQTQGWFRRYRAHVPVKLETRFDPPLPRKKLEAIPDLHFDDTGHLSSFSLPVERMFDIIDVAAGRKAVSGEPVAKEEADFRKRFPPKFLCSDGHWVRSKAELLIDNWLYTRRPAVAHAYERRLPVSEETYCDFYIPICDCYVEYWGLDTPEYSTRQQKKLETYRKYGFKVIELKDRDIEELDDRLPEKLLKFLPSGYRLE